MKILFIADIVGASGRKVLEKELSAFLSTEAIDLVVANGENAAAGFGITPNIANEIFLSGVDVITLGNHTWDKKEVVSLLADKRIVRPLNYPSKDTPGIGYTISLTKKGTYVAVINLMGRVFMNSLDCPFKVIDEVLPKIKKKADVVIVDFHAEATSEKMAFGCYLDGRVSAVIGTHTHVATCDERIFEKGTAYITDAGFTGAHDSVIGIKKDIIIKKFLTQVPVKYEMATDMNIMEGVLLDIDEKTGKAISIQRIKKGI
jgi:metallophosphoesterase (TIGR00282 family)